MTISVTSSESSLRSMVLCVTTRISSARIAERKVSPLCTRPCLAHNLQDIAAGNARNSGCTAPISYVGFVVVVRRCSLFSVHSLLTLL